MIPELGPKPQQYIAQPHLYGVHRRLYEMLGERVANHLGVTALPRDRQQELGDAFERAQEQHADEPHPQRPDAIGRLISAVYDRLIMAGLLPPRPTEDINASMAGHSRDVAVAVNRFNLLSQRHWSTLNDKIQEIRLNDGLSERLDASLDPDSLLSESNIDKPKAPEGLLLIGRLPLADMCLPERYAGISKVHLAAQLNGNYLILRDGFYPVDTDGTGLVGGSTWRPSTNGSFYFDDENHQVPIPSDRAIVLPNKPTKVKLGKNYFEINTTTFRTLRPDEIEPLQVAQVNNAHVETNRRFNTMLRRLEEGPTRTIVLGREEDAGFVVRDERVSRYHARISYNPTEQQFYVQDLESTNGTTILRGGQDIPVGGTAIRLEQRDNLRIGRTMLYVNSTQLPQ